MNGCEDSWRLASGTGLRSRRLGCGCDVATALRKKGSLAWAKLSRSNIRPSSPDSMRSVAQTQAPALFHSPTETAEQSPPPSLHVQLTMSTPKQHLLLHTNRHMPNHSIMHRTAYHRAQQRLSSVSHCMAPFLCRCEMPIGPKILVERLSW